jgi:hypothetical protein
MMISRIRFHFREKCLPAELPLLKTRVFFGYLAAVFHSCSCRAKNSLALSIPAAAEHSSAPPLLELPDFVQLPLDDDLANVDAQYVSVTSLIGGAQEPNSLLGFCRCTISFMFSFAVPRSHQKSCGYSTFPIPDFEI